MVNKWSYVRRNDFADPVRFRFGSDLRDVLEWTQRELLFRGVKDGTFGRRYELEVSTGGVGGGVGSVGWLRSS